MIVWNFVYTFSYLLETVGLCDTTYTMEFKRWLLIGLAIIVVFGSGYGVRALTSRAGDSADSVSAADYPLLARRIFIEKPNDALINFASLRAQIQNYFDDNGLKGSLYFEYLPTGVSARITADEEQVAASLMKLPAAMDAMKAIEKGKISADYRITLKSEWLDSGYGELYKKGAGYTLTLQDAIKTMLVDSDNTALQAVVITTMDMVSSEESVLNAVDVDLTQNVNLSVSIGARSYASFLKCLYFACYNERESSNELLSYLSETPFDGRLVAGIADTSITTAHKIGVYDTVQSDCGIIYAPSRPYALCVMLSGQDNETTDRHIAELSRITYEYVTSQ